MNKNKRAKINWYSKKHGITLISLVITIVVMLILAGVAISIAIDPEGLFGKAEEAKTDWNAKVDEEQDKIDEVLGWLPGSLPAGWDSSKVADVVEEDSTRLRELYDQAKEEYDRIEALQNIK